MLGHRLRLCTSIKPTSSRVCRVIFLHYLNEGNLYVLPSRHITLNQCCWGCDMVTVGGRGTEEQMLPGVRCQEVTPLPVCFPARPHTDPRLPQIHDLYQRDTSQDADISAQPPRICLRVRILRWKSNSNTC